MEDGGAQQVQRPLSPPCPATPPPVKSAGQASSLQNGGGEWVGGSPSGGVGIIILQVWLTWKESVV